MTDDLTVERGLGALADSPDPRDYPIDALYEAEDLVPVALDALPAAFRVAAPRAPILDQGSSPMCVAYSSARQKAYADRRDMLRWFDFNEPLFFHQIGGTEKGAEVRWAMQRMVDSGYPPVGSGSATDHRIAAYYVIPSGPGFKGRIQQALVTFGTTLVLSTRWYRSWFHPRADGTLPHPDVEVGGHAIDIDGYTADGLVLANSWGTDWGTNGLCVLPWAYLEQATAGRAAWRAVDVVEHPVPYVRTVRAKERVRLRSKPRLTGQRLGLIPDGAQMASREIEKYGGKYQGPGGHQRTDWLLVSYGGHIGWVARAYTREVK